MFDRIEGTMGKVMYQLTKEDVDCFLKFAPVTDEGGGGESADIVGPVLPAPPRLTKIDVVGNLVPGGYAIADVKYSGGYQGASEFWWLNIRQGQRLPLGEARPAAVRRSTDELLELARQVQESGDSVSRDKAKNILNEDPRVTCVKDECRLRL